MKAARLPLQGLALLTLTALFAACGGGGGGTPPTTNPTATPTTAPTGPPTSQPPPSADFVCPTSDSTTANGIGSGTLSSTRRIVAGGTSPETVPGMIAVEYDSGTLAGTRSTLAVQMKQLNATVTREMPFTNIGRTVQIVRVAPQAVASTMTALRALPGVRTVAQVQRRFPLTVNARYFTTDPYFTGFATTIPPSPGATAPPPTNNLPPYYESADVPGQWDMHVVGLDYAFDYSQTNNGSGIAANSNALGNSNVKVAIIDTGEDTGAADLAGKFVNQKCFITNPSNVQSTSNFTTDSSGHGTDVSGIAAAAANNKLGFVGDGGNVSLMGYRVFPTFDSSCDNETTGDATCSATTIDIADAISDAVANHANVISMSLGSCCGADTPPESTAVESAITAGVIVVAAAGNDNGQTKGYTPGGSVADSIDAPANNPGVIAVGASALNDGQPNGRHYTGPNPEYIAAYSNYAATNTPKSTASWGMVAPGGDAASTNDADDLHWIENLWTSTPYDANDAGSCKGDYPSESGTPVCRILIDGTSMSTPHVAGAAALILSVAPTYQNPAKMFALLCQTADDIKDAREGCGRLNVYRAMATALGDPSPP